MSRVFGLFLGLLLWMPQVFAQNTRQIFEVSADPYKVEVGVQVLSASQGAVSRAAFDVTLLQYKTASSWDTVSFDRLDVSSSGQGDGLPAFSVAEGPMTQAQFTYDIPPEQGLRGLHLVFFRQGKKLAETDVALPGQQESLMIDYIAFILIGFCILIAISSRFFPRT